MATVAAGASSPTAGYDRAFWISAAALGVGAVLALVLPGKPKPEPQAAELQEIAPRQGELVTTA